MRLRATIALLFLLSLCGCAAVTQTPRPNMGAAATTNPSQHRPRWRLSEWHPARGAAMTEQPQQSVATLASEPREAVTETNTGSTWRRQEERLTPPLTLANAFVHPFVALWEMVSWRTTRVVPPRVIKPPLREGRRSDRCY